MSPCRGLTQGSSATTWWLSPAGEAALNRVAKDFGISAQIISVIQAGDVANVVLGFGANDDPAQSWLDIHSLLRLDGTWKIMNKTATHATRADWTELGARGSETAHPSRRTTVRNASSLCSGAVTTTRTMDLALAHPQPTAFAG